MDIDYCSHVLELVIEDVKAMKEIFRVLTDTDWSVFVIPNTVAKTIEDTTITDPPEREQLFGQRDHVCRYGPDFITRLQESSFHLKRYTSRDIVGKAGIDLNGTKDRGLYLCKKHSVVISNKS